MNGSDLRRLFESKGIELDRAGIIEKIALRMSISASTLRQNLKPSVIASENIIALVDAYIVKVRDSAREQLRLKHNAYLEYLVLSVFDESLPNLSLHDFAAYPDLLHEQARPDYSHQQSRNVLNWEIFITEFQKRANRNYTDEKTVLMGQPGSGKTSVMKRLLLHLENEHQENDPKGSKWTPVFVSASIYDDRPIDNIFTAIALYYEKAWNWDHELSILRLLQLEKAEEKLVVFIDSLDEATPLQRSKIISHVRECKVPVILSSRYCEPRIDVVRFTQRVFHLGGLSLNSVCLYIKEVKKTIDEDITIIERATNESRKGSKTSQILEVLLKRFQEVAELFRSHSSDSMRDLDGDTEQGWDDDTGQRLDDAGGNIMPNGRRSGDSAIATALTEKLTNQFFQPNAFLINDSRGQREQFRAHYQALFEKTRRAREWLSLLATPFYLNLYIALCIKSGVNNISIDKLVHSYVSMLLGSWQRTRSVYRGIPDGTDLDETSIVDALGAVAIHSIMREHVDGDFLTEANVRHTLKAHIKLTDLADRNESELWRDVEQTLEAAYEAHLLIESDGGRVRFSAPHELFATYFAAIYASKAQSIIDASSFRQRGASTKDTLSLFDYGSYRNFLTNPNLRFLEDTVVLYLQSELNRHNVSPLALSDRLEEAWEQPPIKSEFTNLSDEQLRVVFPANEILLGRFFTLPPTRQLFRTRFKKLFERIEALYLNTDFEMLFQTVSPIYRTLNPKPDQIISFTPEFRVLDSAWRTLERCEDLVGLAHYVESHEVVGGNRPPEENKKIILRRIAYVMRYFASTFSNSRATFDWMNSRYQWYLDNEPTRRHLVVNSLRMIYDSTPASTSELYRELHEWIHTRINESERKRTTFRNTLRELDVINGSSQSFMQRVIEEESIDLDQLEWYPIDLTMRLRRLEVEGHSEASISHLFENLLKFQGKRRELESAGRINTNEFKDVLHDEARVLRLMMYMSNSFIGQQYFMPDVYSLAQAEVFYPKVQSYDRGDLLRCLFGGISLHFSKNNHEGGRENLQHYSIGGWQLYDYYIQCIWAIMRYVPSQTHYMYMS